MIDMHVIAGFLAVMGSSAYGLSSLQAMQELKYEGWHATQAADFLTFCKARCRVQRMKVLSMLVSMALSSFNNAC